MAEDHTYARASDLVGPSTSGSSDPKEIQSEDKGLYQDMAASNAFQLDPLDKGLLKDPKVAQEDCYGSTKYGKPLAEDVASNAILFQREFDSSLNQELKNNKDLPSKPAEPLNEKGNSFNTAVTTEAGSASNAKTFKLDAKSPGTKDVTEMEICQLNIDDISDQPGAGPSSGSLLNPPHKSERRPFLVNDSIWLHEDDYNNVDIKSLVAGGSTLLKKQDQGNVTLFNDADKDMVLKVIKSYETAKSLASKWRTIQMRSTDEDFAACNNMYVRKLHALHVHCILCFAKVRYELEYMKKHVLSRNHLRAAARTECHNLNSYIHNVMPAREFIPFRIPLIDFVWESTWFTSRQDIVLNKTFCLRRDSFNLLRVVSTTHLLCYVCKGAKAFESDTVHRTIEHTVAHNLSLVLTEFKDEFIREILDRKFHCGFCNMVLPSMRDVKNHMRGIFHHNQKLQAYIRLHKYMPHRAHLEAFAAIEEGRSFTPDWTGRPSPGSR